MDCETTPTLSEDEIWITMGVFCLIFGSSGLVASWTTGAVVSATIVIVKLRCAEAPCESVTVTVTL